MMDFLTHTHLNWPELLEMGLFILLVLFILLMLVRYFILVQNKNVKIIGKVAPKHIRSWDDIPEVQLLVMALPLQLLWEIAQFPLYTVWHEGNWSYILYGLVHCTLGDMLIMLSTFWIVSLLNHSRYWIFSPSLPNIVLYTVICLGYTIYSEIINTRIKETWGYTELMPIVPVIEIGGMPFLQWLLIPPILIWLMQIVRLTHKV